MTLARAAAGSAIGTSSDGGVVSSTAMLWEGGRLGNTGAAGGDGALAGAAFCSST